jgi:hypothetical protein
MNFSFIQPIITKLVWLRDALGNTINPATKEWQDILSEWIDRLVNEGTPIIGASWQPFLQWDNGEIGTYDTNLSQVLGSSSLVEDQKLRTKSSNFDLQNQNFKITGLNSEAKVLTNGFSTCNVQISWTWVGTLTFEITSNWWDFIAIAGISAATNTVAYSTTGNGIFRFNITGLHSVKVRFSAFTSGTPFINFNLSAGWQWQPFAQNAAGAITTTEAVIDTNLPFIAPSQMYETGFELEWWRIVEPTIAPTQPATYAQNKFAQYPQKFRRLRVEIWWSQKVPFAQEANTNKMIVTEPELRAVLELMYIELQNIRNVLLGNNDSLN